MILKSLDDVSGCLEPKPRKEKTDENSTMGMGNTVGVATIQRIRNLDNFSVLTQTNKGYVEKNIEAFYLVFKLISMMLTRVTRSSAAGARSRDVMRRFLSSSSATASPLVIPVELVSDTL